MQRENVLDFRGWRSRVLCKPQKGFRFPSLLLLLCDCLRVGAQQTQIYRNLNSEREREQKIIIKKQRRERERVENQGREKGRCLPVVVAVQCIHITIYTCMYVDVNMMSCIPCIGRKCAWTVPSSQPSCWLGLFKKSGATQWGPVFWIAHEIFSNKLSPRPLSPSRPKTWYAVG